MGAKDPLLWPVPALMRSNVARGLNGGPVVEPLLKINLWSRLCLECPCAIAPPRARLAWCKCLPGWLNN